MLKTLLKVNDRYSPSRMSMQVGVAIILVALLVRGFVCFRDVEQYAADDDAYRLIAETLANTGIYGRKLLLTTRETIPIAYRPPFYPYVLSLLVLRGELSFYAIAGLHTLLGCVTAWCTYRASRRLLGEVHGFRASILAAGLVIVDPVLLQQSTLVMTETMATAISSLVLWWWVRHAARSTSYESAVVLGVLLALAYLCRPTFYVWGMMLTFCVAVVDSRVRKKKDWRIGRAVIVGAILLSAVGFWTIRNYRAIGYPVWATTHGGYTLLLGNNPLFYEYLRSGEFGSTWDAGDGSPFQLAYSHRYDADPTTEAFWLTHWDSPGTIPVAVSEHEDDRRVYDAATASIAREPRMFVWSCAVRIGRLWSPLPHRTAGRSWALTIAVGLYYVAFYVAVGCGLWRLGREVKAAKWWPVWTLVLTLTLVHALYWSNIRMRAPVIPAIAIIAAAAIRRSEEADL